MAENSESIENEVVTYAMYECLVCGHKEKIRGKRKDYSEVVVCPECNGAFIDTFKIMKYKNDNKLPSQKKNNELSVKVDIDVLDALKGLKAVQREAKRTARILKELEGTKTLQQEIIIHLNGLDNPTEFSNAVKKELEKMNE